MCTKSVHERRRDELTTQKSRALVGARGELALQTHHVADDLGHRLEMLGRNRIVDLDRGVLFLVADEGGFITGSTLSINGGQHMY